MAKDSSLWEAAYGATPKQTYKAYRKPKKIKPIKVVVLKRPELDEHKVAYLPLERQQETMVVMQELREVIAELERLTNRKRVLRRQLAGQKLLKNDYYNRPIKLYAIRCEDNCWYVGMSRNPNNRYKKHGTAKGAMWTKLHKPIELFEVRDTGSSDDRAVNLMEDDMTLEYALKYGSQYVRGGGYCQVRSVRWPALITQNEKSI